MRDLPPRRTPPIQLGFDPTNASLDARLDALARLSDLARTIGDRPLARGWTSQIRSYADAVWGATRVLRDAARAQSTSYSLLTNTKITTPEYAAPYTRLTQEILDRYHPDHPLVRVAPPRGESPGGWVSWSSLADLGTFLNAADWTTRTGGFGQSADFERARAAKDELSDFLSLLIRRLDAQGFATRPTRVTESSDRALARWRASADEGESEAPAPAPDPAVPRDPIAPRDPPPIPELAPSDPVADPAPDPTRSLLRVGAVVMAGIGVGLLALGIRESANATRGSLALDPDDPDDRREWDRIHREREEEAERLRLRREARYGPSATAQQIRAWRADLDRKYFPTVAREEGRPNWARDRRKGAQGD